MYRTRTTRRKFGYLPHQLQRISKIECYNRKKWKSGAVLEIIFHHFVKIKRVENFNKFNKVQKTYEHFYNRFQIIVTGICALTSEEKCIEIYDREKKSLEDFLGDQRLKIVELDKVLGIGGEGVVIKKELEITLMQGTESDDRTKAENIRLESIEKKIVALKFVEFTKEDGENVEGQGFNIKANFIIIKI